LPLPTAYQARDFLERDFAGVISGLKARVACDGSEMVIGISLREIECGRLEPQMMVTGRKVIFRIEVARD
jgi:hypothetical protein